MKKISLHFRELSYGYNEEIKQLRTNLLFSGSEKKVFMLTSTIEDEGKSFVSLQLARSLAALHKNVLLIDADLRKSVTSHLAEDPSAIDAGLAHYLTGQKGTDDVIYQTNEKGLFILFAGPIIPPNPSELLANARMKQLIETSKKVFDYIIIDCPPLFVVDGLIIAPNCDGSMLVIEANKISRKAVQKDIEELRGTGCPFLGVVLNKVNYRRNKNYYYKKYGYRYGYSYGSDKKSKSSKK